MCGWGWGGGGSKNFWLSDAGREAGSVGLHADYLSDKRGIQTICFRKGQGEGREPPLESTSLNLDQLWLGACSVFFFLTL